MTAIPRDPPADTPGIRTLGTASIQAAPGNDSRFPATGALTVKASYLGTPSADVYYESRDIAGNVITARTAVGVVESTTVDGLYFYDQIVTLDEFVARWDENDGIITTESIATRHVASLPSPPTSVTAVAGNTSASISFTPGSNGGSAIIAYTVTAIDSTNAGRGGQTATTTVTSGVVVSGLTNGDNYTFTVHASTQIGSSSESAASNSVIPVTSAAVPGPPLNVSAAQTGSGQVTVTFNPPISNGGASITSYLVTAIDETNSAHNTTHAGNSPNVLNGLFNETYHFTVHAVNVVGAGSESASSNSVTLATPTGTGFVPYFSTSTKLTLDATGTTGTLAWEIDHVAQPETDTIVTYGPLTVGTHHVKLTATSGTASFFERDVDVPWVCEPMDMAQADNINGNVGQPSGILGSGLPQWSTLSPIGPWQAIGILNETELYPTVGDNNPRLVRDAGDGSISLLARSVDLITYGHDPATYPINQKYRPNFGANAPNGQLDNTANGRAAGAYAAVANINVAGNLATVSDTTLRFFRFEVMAVGTNWDGSHPPGYPTQMANFNNFTEGGQGGHLYAIQAGATMFVNMGDIVVGPSYNWDLHPTQYDVWQNYVIEVKRSTNKTVGYVRLYRDGAIVTNNVPPGTILTPGAEFGKFYCATQKLNTSGAPLIMTLNAENYRTSTGIAAIGPSYPDFTAKYRNMRVGPTFDSVFTTLLPLPTITSISPTSRARGATNQTIHVTGTNYRDHLPGLTAALSGPGLYGATATGITINSVTVVDSTHVDLNIDISAGAPTGLRTLLITNPTGGVCASAVLTVT